MLVCQCNGISDRTIRRMIGEGASSVGQIARGCGAGACCGGCAGKIRSLILAQAGDGIDAVQENPLESSAIPV